MQCRKSYWLLFVTIFFISLASGAENWVINPTSCPSLDPGNFSGQDCTPDDICGDNSGTAQCFDTSTMVAPTANTTTYSTNNVASDDDGGYSVNCYATADAGAPFCDNNGAYTCERNETFHGSPANRDTVCLGTGSGGTFGDTAIGICKTEGTNMFDCFGDNDCESTATSDCSGSNNNHYITATCNTGPEGGAAGTCECDTDHFACDGSISDGDGCEHLAGSNCASSTGDKVDDQCFSASLANCTNFLTSNSDCNNDDGDSNLVTCNNQTAGDGCEITNGGSCGNSTGTYVASQCNGATGNCTRSTDLRDCDDDDSDANEVTCNGANGCEVNPGSACTVGGLPGTVDDACPFNCAVDNQDIATTGIEVIWSGSDTMLWLTQLGAGLGLNITFSNDKSFTVNATGPYWDGTLLTGGAAGADGTGGWVNTSTTTNTTLNVNVDEGANVTSNWFFGNLNWSDVQNAPAFALITDVQGWISGNRTASEAALRVDIDGNFTDLDDRKLNITDQRYNETQSIIDNNDSWSLDTNFSACSDGEVGFGEGVCVSFNDTVSDLSLNRTEADVSYLNLSGTNANQDVNVSPYNLESQNITIRDRIFMGDLDHWIARGTGGLFDGIATQAFWFHHDEAHEGGTVSFLVTANVSGQNKVNILSQVGRNNSAGVLGNSWMILPNNLTSNLSILSDCFLASSLLNKTVRVFCDTSDTGADLIVQDDIQAFGRFFSDEGIRSENQASFLMNELDFDIVDGDLHLRNSRIETVGFAVGENATLLSTGFSSGLSPFVLITTSGNANEWIDFMSDDCFDSPCARASQILPPTNSIMEANFTTSDFDTLNLSFRINTTNLDAGDLFNVTVNNNTGSGEVQVHAIDDGVDENQLVTVILPTSMNNVSLVSLRYNCNVNVPNEQCLVDDVIVRGTATANTQTNITRFDTRIKGGLEGNEGIFILYNDSSQQWQFSPNNVSFVPIIEVDLNVTGSITLDAETITNWDNVSSFDDNVLLTNGSRPLTGNWNAGSFNITADWFFGNLNWSDVQNAPAFALITDVQGWISGNRTASEAALRVDIDGNFTDLDDRKLNITDQRYNETQSIIDNNDSWSSTSNASYAGLIDNSSYLSTFNKSYDGLIGNASYVSTFNFTYDAYVELNISNQSRYWNNLSTINLTQMEDNNGILNILESWLDTLFPSISDVQGWISGNRTASEAALRVDIDGNFTTLNDTIAEVNTTTNIEALGFVQGAHTVDTNFTDGGIMFGNLNVTENYNITHGGCNEWWNGSCLIRDCATTKTTEC